MRLTTFMLTLSLLVLAIVALGKGWHTDVAIFLATSHIVLAIECAFKKPLKEPTNDN